jgi:hypothetical protein
MELRVLVCAGQQDLPLSKSWSCVQFQRGEVWSVDLQVILLILPVVRLSLFSNLERVLLLAG